MRHVVEVRHDSFCTPDFTKLLRQFQIPVVFSEHETYPAIADITADFVYARLQKGEEKLKTGYPPKALDAWTARVTTWARGGVPDDLPLIDPAAKPKKQSRDVLRLFHSRGQGAGARRGDGADRTAEVIIGLIHS